MKDRNIKLFYLHELFFRFSDDMLVIILPIFIYKLYGSISAVFVFIMIWNLIHGITFIPLFNLAMKLKKPKYFMIIGMVFYIAALYLFSIITPADKSLMPLALLLFALYIAFYWMVRHWFTATNITAEKVGKQIGNIYIIRTMVTFAAPIIGGAISHLVSFNLTFAIGATSAILSLIPIMMFHAPAIKERYSFKSVLRTLKKPDIKAISPAYFFEGVSFVMVLNAWLLMFAIYVGNILDLGLLIGITTLLTALVIWMTGRHFDKRSRVKALNKTTKFRAFTTALYATVMLWPSLSYVWVIEFLNRLSFTTQYTVTDAYIYSYGNKINPVHFPMMREIYLNISRFTASAVMAIVFYFVPTDYLWVAILIGSASVLGMLNIRNSDHLLR